MKAALSPHIKIGNLYEFVDFWVVSDNSYNFRCEISEGEIALLLDFRVSDYNNAYIKFLYNGKIVWRDMINTAAVNRLKLVECE